MANFKTRMTEVLGIEYPIMCGGLQNAANPELAVAISEAGGLGITNISMYPDFDDFRATMKWMREHTKKPLAVNISMIPNIDMGDKIRQYITICGEEGINVIETSGKDPAEFVPLIHSYGMKIVHKVPMARHALKAQKSGVDCVTVVGSEAAGHPSPDLIGTMVVANRAVELCSIPVLVGGGICNGRSMAAALALGAEGVVIGTRFLTASECCISQNHKDWIIEHTEKDTVLCQRAIKNMIRVAHNAAADECLEMEKKPGVTLQDLMPIISGAVGRQAYQSGDTSRGMFAVGQDIGLISDVKPAKEIIEEMLREAAAATERLSALAGV
ncbi:nitronate monooxygenase [Intestinimonas aquisgranensis]|nr:nitronate monooxygenase [Intestinimonas aquisgranensis]